MIDSNEKICSEYRTAKNRVKQIQILAELNGCTKDEIKKILIENGEKLPGNMTAPGQKRPPKPAPAKKPVEKPVKKPVDDPAPISRAYYSADIRYQAIELIRKTVNDEHSYAFTLDRIRAILDMLDAIERM